jgi:alkylated DNA repair dioxygenase AlkB
MLLTEEKLILILIKNKIKKMNIPKGLYYFENVILPEYAESLILYLDNHTWEPITSSSNSRLVQHYGFKYDYLSKSANIPTKKIPKIFDTLREIIIEKMLEVVDSFDENDILFNQMIVNNYYKGQSISKHIDSNAFGKFIGCFTIGNSGVMKFTKNNVSYTLQTKPNSLYIMSGEARYEWYHQMIPLNDDRRISITFRNVNLDI